MKHKYQRTDKAHILKNTMCLFWDKGYFGTSLEDICEASDIYKYSVYHHFGDKKNLYICSLNYYYQEIVSGIKKIIDKSDNAPETIRQIFSLFLNAEEDLSLPSGEFLIHAISEFGQSDPDISKCVCEISGDLEDILKAVVIAGQREKQISNRIKPDDIVFLLKNILCGCLVSIRKGDNIQDIKRRAEKIIREVCV